jgi:anti-anti-sigma factor
MEINVVKQNDEIVMTIVGRVDTVTTPELEKAVQPYFSESGITLIFDCTKMDYISSSGLRVILMAHKQITAKGGQFILRNLVSEVRSVIDMTGFSRIINIQ